MTHDAPFEFHSSYLFSSSLLKPILPQPKVKKVSSSLLFSCHTAHLTNYTRQLVVLRQSAMATEPVTILPMEATAKEVEEMTTVIKQAFGPDQLMEFLFNQPNVPKPPKEEALAKSLERMTNPLFVYHKAVDAVNPDGPILGVAVWYWVEDPQNSTKNIPWGDPAPDVHLGCYEATLGALRSWRLEHFREINQPFVNMALLLWRRRRRGGGWGVRC